MWYIAEVVLLPHFASSSSIQDVHLIDKKDDILKVSKYAQLHT